MSGVFFRVDKRIHQRDAGGSERKHVDKARPADWLPVGIKPVRASTTRSEKSFIPSVRPVNAMLTVRYRNPITIKVPAANPITRGFLPFETALT